MMFLLVGDVFVVGKVVDVFWEVFGEWLSIKRFGDRCLEVKF